MAETPRRDDEPDWIDRVTQAATRLGFNPVKVRWRLVRWRDGLRGSAQSAQETVRQARYPHQSCPACGRLADGSTGTCSACGAKLRSRAGLTLHRIGLALPETLGVTTLLAVVMIAVFARMLGAQGGEDWMEFRIPTLLRFGGHWPPLVAQGEWWRLGTSIFVHVGLWHILFNLLALSQIGPAIERIFGRGRMLFFFVFTGVVANVGSELFGLDAVAAGASGGLMGLIGAAAGWGHRAGTSVGRELRNRMLQWGAYTMIFGLLVGADNAAHAVGFLSGAVLGLVVRPAWWERDRPRRMLGALLALLGFAATVGSVAVCLFPIGSTAQLGTEDEEVLGLVADPNAVDPRELGRRWSEGCAAFRRGDTAAALGHLRAAFLAVGADAEFPEESLPAFCEQFEQQIEQCRKFRWGGLAALGPDWVPPTDPVRRAEAEQAIRSELIETCNALGE